MVSRIWETVAANKIQAGDILAWRVNPVSDGLPDYRDRVKVTEVSESSGSEPLPYVVLRVAGPAVDFEPMAHVRTGRTYRQGDALVRMRPAHAVRVGDNFRTVVRLVGIFSSEERFDAARTGMYPAGMVPGDL